MHPRAGRKPQLKAGPNTECALTMPATHHPANSERYAGRAPMIPGASELPQHHLALVTHDQAVGAGPTVMAADDYLLADQALLEPRPDPFDL